MPVLSYIESAFDRVIGFFNPRSEIMRRLDRQALEQVRNSQYAAATSPRTIGSWSPVDDSINTIIGNSAQPVRARIRQLVRDFPYFSRAVNAIVDYSIGGGIIFQSRIETADGKLDKKSIQLVEDTLNRWFDEADIAKRLHYYEMMALSKRQDLECGEFFLVKNYSKDGKRFLPLCLQMYEADWLTSYGALAKSGNKVHEGVEYNALTGETIAYHFTDPDGWGKTIRIPAERVIHNFKTFRPGQLRGISEFTPGVLVARDLSTYMDHEMDAAKMAAKWVGVLKTDDPYGRQAGTTSKDQYTGQRIDTMQSAIVEFLRPSAREDLQLFSNPRPSSNFPPMVKLILTMLSVVTGVPYEIVSGDYTGINYSQGKMVRNDFAQQLKPVCTRQIRHYCQPIIKEVISSAVMANKLPFNRFFSDPLPYLKGEYQPPGMESIDPSRETKSQIDQIKAGLRSPQEIARSRGRDLEDILKEIKAANDLAEEMGITIDLGSVSTALKNNPAAIEQQP